MRKSRFLTTLLTMTIIGSSFLTGCGRDTSQTPIIGKDKTSEEETVEEEGPITYETSTKGIDSNQKDFEELLTDGMYYVVHEGIYYPVYTYHKNVAATGDLGTTVNYGREIYFLDENFTDIPTLFPGDHLVFYSSTQMLDYASWERYEYRGSTIGVYDLQKTVGGHYYLDIGQETVPIVPGSDMVPLSELAADNITIDRIGNVVVDDTCVDGGIIVGMTPSEKYQVEIYTGTMYKSYTAVASTHALRAYELFASTGINYLQDRFWEIDIPKYFVDGFYSIGDQGLLRIVKGQGYDENTDYNEKLLYVDENAFGVEAPAVYSETADLNKHMQSTYPDKLGYVDPEEEEEASEEEEAVEESLPEAAKFKAANEKEFELYFPDGKNCEIEIVSSSGETTGYGQVELEDGSIVPLSFNRFDSNYTAVIKGKGQRGVLKIGGFWYDYDINLVNAESYKGQGAPVEETPAETEPVEEEEQEEQEEPVEEEETKKGSLFKEEE